MLKTWVSFPSFLTMLLSIRQNISHLSSGIFLHNTSSFQNRKVSSPLKTSVLFGDKVNRFRILQSKGYSLKSEQKQGRHSTPKKDRWLVHLMPLVFAASIAQAKNSNLEAGTQPKTNNMIFTTSGCPYCKRAKAILKSEGVDFQEIGVETNQELRAEIKEKTGRSTVPVVFLNGAYVGGSDDLEKLVASKELQKFLEAEPKSIPESILSLAMAPASSPQKSTQDGAESAAWNRIQLRRLKLEQIAERMADGRQGIPRNETKVSWNVKKLTFTGKDAVTWMLKNLPDVLDETEAEELGKELQAAKLLHHATYSEQFSSADSSSFTLHSDEPALTSALNAKTVWLKPARTAPEVALDLRKRVLELYDLALSADGRSVNYDILAGSQEFTAYCKVAEELQKVDIGALSANESLAFWINIYNSLIIHSIVAKGKPANSFQRLTFYSGNSYNIGGQDFSLDDIEHGVLRGNRPGSANLFGSLPFGPTDPRRFLSLVPRDPRIHFALNCGAKSCPPIKLFDSENVNDALDGAVTAFCESEVEVDEKSGVVQLSKILDWYKVDFGDSEEERLGWLLPYLDEKKRSCLKGLLQNKQYQVKFKPYDWGVNE